MVSPLVDDDQDHCDSGVDILGDVSLQAFKALPASIGPFGASVISWSVKGPAGFSVKLNSLNVPKTGQQVVQPVSTTAYRLSAHAGQGSKFLGTVTVSVDRATCESFEIGNPRSAIEAPVRGGITNSEDLYFANIPNKPNILASFSSGQIRLQLTLRARINNFPNPLVEIDSTFSLVVHNGVLETAAEQIRVDISVPFWVWLIPGAPLGLGIALDMARDRAKKQTHEAIQGVGQVLDSFAIRPPGKQLSTVRVDAGNNGAGVIELTACSDNLLLKLAELSGDVIIG